MKKSLSLFAIFILTFFGFGYSIYYFNGV
uniref:Plectrovirus spv1-r8a2b orf 1 c-terminal truncated transmembrane protein n=1 Tax=Spiroplasma citri TaxID=2133 RepID=Q14L60_SPICI|nr:plectrovirus spv1-r8a2b orf 1 c-terminal truncated transmembrane protein [Spiroplasma citri]